MNLRVYRDGERHKWFEVSGRSPEVCRMIADRECERLGWSSEDIYSERVEKGIVRWITRWMRSRRS